MFNLQYITNIIYIINLDHFLDNIDKLTIFIELLIL